MLSIRSLYASIHGKEVLKGLNLEIKPGEVHAIMGPNGSGKSTLSHILSGREGYEVTGGQIFYEGRDLTELGADERAQAGIFLAFQYPVEIPGVSNRYFMRTSLNAVRKARGLPELDAVGFIRLLKEKIKLMDMPQELLKRDVNAGFSGGEKKKNEILQMALLEPKLAILDETDSGLDIDALKAVAHGVNALRSPDRSMLLITHYQRLLDHIKPDQVHVLLGGRLVRSGDAALAMALEEKGYDWIKAESGAAPGGA